MGGVGSKSSGLARVEYFMDSRVSWWVCNVMSIGTSIGLVGDTSQVKLDVISVGALVGISVGALKYQ